MLLEIFICGKEPQHADRWTQWLLEQGYIAKISQIGTEECVLTDKGTVMVQKLTSVDEPTPVTTWI